MELAGIHAAGIGPRGVLVLASAAQLAAGVAGQVIALRDRRPYDLPLLGQRGRPEDVAHDSWFMGTALSPPIAMLAVHAAATARLAAGPSRTASRILGALGVMMTCGTLLERGALPALAPSGWSRAKTPSVAAGVALSLAMAVLGLRRAKH